MPEFVDMSLEELDEWTMNEMLGKNHSLSAILRGHLVVEQILEVLISKKFEKPKAFWHRDRNYALKVDLANALGVVPEKYVGALKALGRIRNGYAHNSSYEMQIEDLSPFKVEWDETQIASFNAACENNLHSAAELCVIFTVWSIQRLVLG